MTCTRPPELREEQLLAFLAGEGDPEVDMHLESCSHCMERAERLEQVETGLRARLYRVHCPPSQVLGDFQHKLLPRRESQEVSRHLDDCPHCVQELDILRSYLSDVGADLETPPMEALRILVARLAGAAGLTEDPELSPALVGLRGDESGPSLYQANGIQISVEVLNDPTSPGHKQMIGLVLGVQPQNLEVSILKEGQRLTSTRVDDIGNFTLENLAPGIYGIVLRTDDSEIFIPEFNV